MIKRGVLMLIILVLLTAFSSALAEDPVKLKMDLSNNRPEAGEAIHVAITVINAGEQALSGPATLYTPDGKRIREFGEPVLEAGGRASWEGDWTVTAEQLAEGRITFTVKYAYDDNGTVTKKTKHFSKKLLPEKEEKKPEKKDSPSLLDNWDGYSLMGVLLPVKPGKAEDRQSHGKWTLHAGTADITQEFFSDGSMTMTIRQEGKDPVTYPGLYRIVENDIEMYIVRDDGRIDFNRFEAGFDGFHLIIDGQTFSGE